MTAADLSRQFAKSNEPRLSWRETAAPKPPHLRIGNAERKCGNCKMFTRASETCWGYGNYPVAWGELCDSWAHK